MSKTLQGHRIKLKRKKEKNNRKTKQQNRRQSVVAGRQQLTVQYNHDRLIIVERRPKKYSVVSEYIFKAFARHKDLECKKTKIRCLPPSLKMLNKYIEVQRCHLIIKKSLFQKVTFSFLIW